MPDVWVKVPAFMSTFFAAVAAVIDPPFTSTVLVASIVLLSPTSRVPAVTVTFVEVRAAGRTNIPFAPFIFKVALV